jgi:hypothetical protein
MDETRGIIMFNRGNKMVVRAIVALYSLRKFWDGPITFYVETPYPTEFDEVLKYFKCDIIHNEQRHDLKTLVRKNSLFENPPYDLTLWLDIDTVILGKIDKMFDYLDEYKTDLCIPNFCAWRSNGKQIKRRVERFRGLIDDKYIDESIKDHPAVNTGVLSFRRSDNWKAFVQYWTDLADRASQKKVFIPDEVACQILLPSIQEWGLTACIAPTSYNVSPLHDHGHSKEPIIAHFHGDKHVLAVPLCDIWKSLFKEMTENNIANINAFLKYSDKRLKQYIKGENIDVAEDEYVDGEKQTETLIKDVTIVTACDEYYVDILRETFANWRKYKNIDAHPVIVFYNGMKDDDHRLEFLRLPNVTLIPWNEDSMDKVDSHRELMLSAFVLGTAKHVKTDYWIKLDADSYATNNKPLYDDDFKKYAMVSHKWGYSRPEFIKKLDEWAKNHWRGKLKLSKPMIDDGRIEGNRFYHNTKRNISYIQFHKTKFIKFCVKLLKENRLPVPSHDTYTFFVCQKFDPQAMMLKNFKRDYGFTQGRGKLGAEHIKQKLLEVENNIVNDEDDGENEDAKTNTVKNEVDKFYFPIVKSKIEFPPICRCPEGEDSTIEIKELK